MEILGVGPLELLFIILIMLVLLGPKDMVNTARKAGVMIRKVIRSPMWASIMDTSREIRTLPTRLVREAGLEEDLKTIRNQTQAQTREIQELTQQIKLGTGSTDLGFSSQAIAPPHPEPEAITGAAVLPAVTADIGSNGASQPAYQPPVSLSLAYRSIPVIDLSVDPQSSADLPAASQTESPTSN